MKIVGILRPFDLKQTFYVFDNGNKVDFAKVKADDVPDTVLSLANQYNITEVNLNGSKQYVAGMINQIQKAEMAKYNKNTLEFNYI